jgi:hypothetical protein
MTSLPTPPATEPAPTPGDQLLGRVITALAVLVGLALLIVGAAVVLERTIPDVLGQVVIAGVTALGAVLAGRSRA